MKALHDIYTPETRALVEAFNAKLAAVETERGAIEQERSQLAVDAVGGNTPAAKLAKRQEAIRLRTVQVMIDELVALRDLPAIDTAARADWNAEHPRRRKIVDERVAELNRHADELKIDKPQRHSLIVTDPVRREAEAMAQAAVAHTNERMNTPTDIARAEQLKVEIVRALR